MRAVFYVAMLTAVICPAAIAQSPPAAVGAQVGTDSASSPVIPLTEGSSKTTTQPAIFGHEPGIDEANGSEPLNQPPEPESIPGGASAEAELAADGLSSEESLEERVRELEKRLNKFTKSKTLWTHWDGGIHLDTRDDEFQLRLGIRIENDWAVFDAQQSLEDEVKPLEDGTQFRRLRLSTRGIIYDTVKFKLDFDFVSDEPGFKSVYIGLVDSQHEDIFRVGFFNEPFGLERVTSSRYSTFMERALPDALNPRRNVGLLLFDDFAHERMTFAAGAFRETDSLGEGQGDDGYAFTGRISGLLWYCDEGQQLLHLAAAFSHRRFFDEEVRFRQRPESKLARRFVNTGKIDADRGNYLGLEAALVCGSASLQAEYMHNFIDTLDAPDSDFSGGYVQASYFLTGEHRRYKRHRGGFARIKPKSRFGKRGGRGAWEVATRLSHLDLNSGDIDGGRLTDFTVGLNWYLNANTRFMGNYVLADLADAGLANIFQMRFQLDY